MRRRSGMGSFIGRACVHAGSKKILSGNCATQRSAPRIWSTDFEIARLYQRFQFSCASTPAGQATDFALKISTWSPQTTRRSHSSLPSPLPRVFLSMNVFGYDQRLRKVRSANFATYCSDGLLPEPRSTREPVDG